MTGIGTATAADASAGLAATSEIDDPVVRVDINRQVARAERAWRDALVDLLRPALAVRGPDVDVDVQALADHLYTTFEGAFVLCRTLEDPSAMWAQLRTFRQLVGALLNAG